MDVVAERFGGRGGDSPEEKRVPWWVAAFHLTPHEFKRLFLKCKCDRGRAEHEPVPEAPVFSRETL